jgi:Fic family protein
VKRGLTGHYVTTSTTGGERVRAFVPDPLPPKPSLDIDAKLRDRLDEAHLDLGRLDSVTTLLPDTQLFLYMYVRKEAVLSSQIEGTQSSLSDLLLFEADALPDVPIDDVTEVSNYVAAMQHGLRRIREDFPLSNRLLREMHAKLLARGRGSEKQPGEFRRSQNWIGGSRPGDAVFVPPPPHELSACLGALEKWLHDKPERTPTVLKAALAHVQFETIHPFLDGNGRVGRLLVTLLLCAEGVLREPLLYLSLYLKRHRSEYYALLERVRATGEWEDWIGFFADGIRESAAGAVATARRLVTLAEDDRDRVASLGRAAGSAMRIHHALQQRPVANAAQIAKRTRLSMPAVTRVLAALERIDVVREITGRRRNRVFSYDGYVKILSEGTEPL